MPKSKAASASPETVTSNGRRAAAKPRAAAKRPFGPNGHQLAASTAPPRRRHGASRRPRPRHRRVAGEGADLGILGAGYDVTRLGRPRPRPAEAHSSASTSTTTSSRTTSCPKEKKDVVKQLKAAAKDGQRRLPGDRPRPRGRGDRLAPRRGRWTWSTRQPRSSASTSTRSPRTRSARRFEHPREIDMQPASMPSRRGASSTGWSATRSARCSGRRSAAACRAGRVQSVAVRLVVEREREIEAFVPVEYWTHRGRSAQAGAPRRQPTLPRRLLEPVGSEEGRAAATSEQAEAIVPTLDGAALRRRRRSSDASSTGSPAAPFTTSTLQQEASPQARLRGQARRWPSPSSSTRASSSAARARSA